jgi:Replication protein
MSAIVMQERFAPSRPYRSGTQRRRARQGRAVPELGAVRSRKARAHSLDTRKELLATTVANWMKDQETEWDRRENRVRLWRVLCSTVYGIWQEFARELHSTPRDGAEWRWWAAYEAEKEAVRSDQSPGYDAWLTKYVQKHEITAATARGEVYFHSLYLEQWRKSNPAVGIARQVLKWEKQYFQLYHCQAEWVGYRAACCGEKTTPIAVPIGCNHRLCPLCNWQRSQNAQRRIKQLFDRLEHPWLITLTEPNTAEISKGSLHAFRKRVNKFIAQHREIKGGVYSIETTYNRTEATWHVHAHILADAAFALPASSQRITCADRDMPAFTLIKYALEFDWLKMALKNSASAGKTPRKNASASIIDGARFEFETWIRDCSMNSVREWRPSRDPETGHWIGKWVPASLPAAELARRQAWNRENRRVIDVRPVTDREKAVKEVLKYITKCSEFIDLPEAVIHFHDATRGARLIQTFGSWYGVDFSADFDTKHLDDWSHMPKCTCGLNEWLRMGIFQRRDVRFEQDGRCFLKAHFDHNARGTLARPTIRALDAPEQRTGDRP